MSLPPLHGRRPVRGHPAAEAFRIHRTHTKPARRRFRWERTPFVAVQNRKPVAHPLGLGFQRVLPCPLRPAFQVAPETLLQIGKKCWNCSVIDTIFAMGVRLFYELGFTDQAKATSHPLAMHDRSHVPITVRDCRESSPLRGASQPTSFAGWRASPRAWLP